MSKLYNRDLEIFIQENETEVLKINGFNISFSIKKPNPKEKQSQNTAEIDIFNLSNETRNKIKSEQTIIINAGYKEFERFQLMFTGDILEVIHKRDKPNVITTIKAQDGFKKLRDSALSLSYKPGTSLKQIAGDIAEKLGFSKDSVSNSLQNIKKSFSDGMSFAGKAKQVLDALSEVGDFNWNFQNNNLQINLNNPDSQKELINLTPETGLIGSPEKLNNVFKTKKKIEGWKVKSLLSPKIKPNDFISITSDDIQQESLFQVVDVEHSGETFGNNWFTNMKVINYE